MKVSDSVFEKNFSRRFTDGSAIAFAYNLFQALMSFSVIRIKMDLFNSLLWSRAFFLGISQKWLELYGGLHNDSTSCIVWFLVSQKGPSSEAFLPARLWRPGQDHFCIAKIHLANNPRWTRCYHYYHFPLFSRLEESFLQIECANSISLFVNP